jgi:hypothetical protein
MKSKAAALTTNWEKMTDLARGDALADVLIAANKYLTRVGKKKNSKTEKAKEAAANRFRSFFKTALESMSSNCRVLALERIFEKVDAIDDDPKASKELKKANNSVFAEMARQRYIVMNRIKEEDNDETVGLATDLTYRFFFNREKYLMHQNNVIRDFGKTKNYMLAKLKFDFSRHLNHNLIEDDYRVDRFGNVLEEDKDKKLRWEHLFKEIAEADAGKLLEIQRKFYTRVNSIRVKPEWYTEKGFKKDIYNAKVFNYAVTSIQNLTTDFHRYDKESVVATEIKKWNAAHPKDLIPIKMSKEIKEACDIYGELVRRRDLYEKVPSFAALYDVGIEHAGTYVSGLRGANGITERDSLEFLPSGIMKWLLDLKRFIRDPKEKCKNDRDTGLHIIHKSGEEFDEAKDVDEEGYLINNPADPLVYQYEKQADAFVAKVKNLEKTGYLQTSEKHAMALERLDKRITLFTKVEADAMKKLDAIVGDKGDKTERAAIDKLYKDYIAELEVQAAAAETVFQADMDAMEGDHSVYFSELQKYYEGRAKINRLFDELENAREQYLEKNSDSKEFENWKKELSDSRIKAREQLAQIENAYTTAEERVKQAFFAHKAGIRLEGFTNKEFEEVKKNNDPHGSWDDAQRNRILDTFIVPANRDFSGAYLTDQDRYHADFNKRFKIAMMSGKEDEIKALSREFTKKTLPLVKYYEPESIDKITPEDVEEKLVKTGQINYTRVKLQMLNNVHSANTNYPLLKTGLDELEKEDPEAYKKLYETLSMTDPAMIGQYMNSLGFDFEHMVAVNEKAKNAFKMAFQVLARDYLQTLEKMKKK